MKRLGHHDAHTPGVEGRDQSGLRVAAAAPDAVQVSERDPPEALHHQQPLRAEAIVHLFFGSNDALIYFQFERATLRITSTPVAVYWVIKTYQVPGITCRIHRGVVLIDTYYHSVR